jgi:hypothetical protein
MNTIEQALRSKAKPSTFEAVHEHTGLSMATVRAEFANNGSFHLLIHENKMAKRLEFMTGMVKSIEALAKRESITNRQAAIKLGVSGDTHSRFVRQLGIGLKYKVPRYKEYTDKIREALNEGATSVLEAARMKGVPAGCVHGAVGGCEDIYEQAEANARAKKDKHYEDGYKAICEQLEKGLTINEASDAAGLDRNFYYRSRKHLGIKVESKPEPERVTNVPGGAYNRLLTMPLTGKSSCDGVSC